MKVSPQFYVTAENGFLPKSVPLTRLPNEFAVLESILNRMPLVKDDGQPGLLAFGKLKETVDKELPQYDVSTVRDSALAAALYRDYAFLASAYLLEPCHLQKMKTGTLGRGRHILPKNVAVPFCRIAEMVNAKPFMEYAQSYALYNWRRKDPRKPISFENLELIRKFTGLPSEKGFILVHVEMVSKSPKLVESVISALQSADMNSRNDFCHALNDMLEAMRDINAAMDTMWKRSKPSDYLKYRTFIMGIKNQTEMFPNGVIYEGVDYEGDEDYSNEKVLGVNDECSEGAPIPCPKPRFYRGESGANDSIIPTMDNFLQLTEQMPNNAMTLILKDFRSYRPRTHAMWLEWVEQSAKRVHVEKYAKGSIMSHWLYILLLEQVREFRSRHWDFAKGYILKYVRGSNSSSEYATGGSPMATWLPNQLSVVLDAIVHNCNEICQMPGSEIDRLRQKAIAEKRQLDKEVKSLKNGNNGILLPKNARRRWYHL